MKQLRIELADRSYNILIGRGLLGDLNSQITLSARRALIITNPVIHQLYGSRLSEGLHQAGIQNEIIEVPEGETHKSLQQAERLYDILIDRHCDRSTLLVALGGGVIGDLTGFIASTYQRGIPYVQVPTTLLSQVDSSVGGKTAVNHPRGKNMIGAFYQPKVVLIDLETLASLPMDEYRAGISEIIKYGVIEDPALFEYLEQNVDRILQQDAECLEHIIERSCSIKAKVVERDEQESSYRMVLNYGHTLGHAVEALTHYKSFKHGEAIAIGMVYAARLSNQLGKCSEEVVQRITQLVERFGLPVSIPDFPAEDYVESMRLDKKARDNKIKFILVHRIGTVEIADGVSESDLASALPSS